MPRNPQKRRCARPECRAWARAGSAHCRWHGPGQAEAAPAPQAGGGTGPGPREGAGSPLGIYAAALTPEERRLLEQAGDCLDLEPEIWLLRVMSRRLFLALSRGEGDAESLRKLASVLYQGLARLAQLMRARRAVNGEAADGLAGALAQALDAIDNIQDWNR